jgi:5-methylcytosine-specific restriction protein A
MAELVETVDEILVNVSTLHRYASGSAAEREFHRRTIKNGKVFVALAGPDGYLFAPSRFAGYRSNNLDHKDDLDNRDGRTTYKCMDKLLGPVRGQGDVGYAEIHRAYYSYCSSFGIVPSADMDIKRRYWVLGDFAGPDEVRIGDAAMYEGSLQRIWVNRYERSPEARALCIAKHGSDCAVCGFNFEKRYGEIGRGYIHVHHLVPLASIGKMYRIDPIADLRPVCPNCHAMLHRGDGLSIGDLAGRLRK